MECFDNSASLSVLRISKASELRCTANKFTSCGQCECCEIGNQLTYTKEWFLRCGEQTKRQFVLGLVHRFNSPDLHEYVNGLLITVEGKDFTYARSRNRPSLRDDMSSPLSNHALDQWQVSRDMSDCLSWFESKPYWTKYNFMLGLMQVCNAHLLQIIGNESRSFCLRKNEYDSDETEAKEVDEEVSPRIGELSAEVEEDSRTTQTPSGRMLANKQVATGTADHEKEQDRNQYEGPSLKVTFGSACDSPTSQCSQDNDHLISNKHQNFFVQQRPRSAMRNRKTQDLKSALGVSFSEPGERLSSTVQLAYQVRPLSSPVVCSRNKSGIDFETFGGKDVRGVSDGELSDALDDDYVSVDPSSTTDLPLSSSCSLVQHHKDFIRCLPVHLSKFILSFLDKASLTNCLCISRHWRILVEEVKKDAFILQDRVEEVMMMQGATAKGLDPRYAKKLFVCVPEYEDDSRPDEIGRKQPSFPDVISHPENRTNEIQFRSMAYCYEGVETVAVEMEERNLFCGPYNVFVLQNSEDSNRCTTFNGGNLVACGSSDRRVRLLNASTGRVEKIIQGHAGSVRCLCISEKRGVVLSGSYDTSIRCWDIRQGKCKCIFRGHRATVLCLALSGNNLASGSRDKSVKGMNVWEPPIGPSQVKDSFGNFTNDDTMWNFETGRCRRTFRHRHVVRCIDVSDSLVVSGCEGCKIKVWDIESATKIKTLGGHQRPISGITFNKYHIVSSSNDCYALAWSAIGKHKKCLQAFRHPKEVLCVKMMYCRIITGAADGKLRIWNLLSGDCLRIIRGNSKNDDITSLYIADNRIVINTLSHLLILNFEAAALDYSLPPDRPESLTNLHTYSNSPPRRRSRAYVRAQKQAQGACVESLVSGPALSCPSFSGYLDRSVSITPFTMRPSPSRITSAPANVTRQISQSIDHHVQRLNRARQRKPRPHSSPSTFRQRRGYQKPVSPDKSCPFATSTAQNILVKDVIKPAPKPDSLPNKRSWHILERGRSVPAIHTAVLPGRERGWTTSVKDAMMVPHNKLMPTAEQSREFISRRPKSAQVASKRNEGPVSRLKSASWLNLKTYSAQTQSQG